MNRDGSYIRSSEWMNNDKQKEMADYVMVNLETQQKQMTIMMAAVWTVQKIPYKISGAGSLNGVEIALLHIE